MASKQVEHSAKQAKGGIVVGIVPSICCKQRCRIRLACWKPKHSAAQCTSNYTRNSVERVLLHRTWHPRVKTFHISFYMMDGIVSVLASTL
jgi:hypothetical protein